MVGLFIPIVLLCSTIPGSTVHKYDEPSRKQGMYMLYVLLALFVFRMMGLFACLGVTET